MPRRLALLVIVAALCGTVARAQELHRRPNDAIMRSIQKMRGEQRQRIQERLDKLRSDPAKQLPYSSELVGAFEQCQARPRPGTGSVMVGKHDEFCSGVENDLAGLLFGFGGSHASLLDSTPPVAPYQPTPRAAFSGDDAGQVSRRVQDDLARRQQEDRMRQIEESTKASEDAQKRRVDELERQQQERKSLDDFNKSLNSHVKTF